MFAVVNKKTALALIALLVIVFTACCSTGSEVKATDIKANLSVISECANENIFDPDEAKSFGHFMYKGNWTLFNPDPGIHYESTVITCLNTNKGTIVVGQSRNRPGYSVSQSSINTYLYKNKQFTHLKNLNQSWSCIGYYDSETARHLKVPMECKGSLPGNGNLDSSYDQAYEVDIL